MDSRSFTFPKGEYFSGIEKGDFYEEPVQGEYPDW